MQWRLVIKTVGSLVFILGLTMLLPLLTCLFYKDAAATALELAIGLTLVSGLLLYAIGRQAAPAELGARDAIAIVSFGWAAVGLFGALPFLFSGEFGPPVDAVFESVSGFTTTGASILTDIESVSKSLLFWRSFIQWLGGMGIIVLSIAILPFIGVGGMQLYKAEVPSPVPDKLKPRIKDTASILWKVYVLITTVEIGLLLLGGVSLFDAVCHALTTLPTGGFSTKNTSAAFYNSAYIDTILIIFMLLAGINFSLHYQLLRGKPLAFWKDAECRFFLGMVFVLTLIVSVDIYGSVYETFGRALRYGAFQIASIVTTTGYATADYEQWPALSQLILLLCMIVGASAGSTGGGVKCLRVMLCLKYCYRELIKLVHPHAVKHIKINRETVSEDVVRSVMGFLALYMVIFALSALLLAWIGVDFLTAIGAVAASLGNIGPGFGLVGPVENYVLIPDAGKWLLIWCMLVGRLEIFTVIILIVPEFWRR